MGTPGEAPTGLFPGVRGVKRKEARRTPAGLPRSPSLPPPLPPGPRSSVSPGLDAALAPYCPWGSSSTWHLSHLCCSAPDFPPMPLGRCCCTNLAGVHPSAHHPHLEKTPQIPLPLTPSPHCLSALVALPRPCFDHSTTPNTHTHTHTVPLLGELFGAGVEGLCVF